MRKCKHEWREEKREINRAERTYISICKKCGAKKVLVRPHYGGFRWWIQKPDGTIIHRGGYW